MAASLPRDYKIKKRGKNPHSVRLLAASDKRATADWTWEATGLEMATGVLLDRLGFDTSCQNLNLEHK